MRWLAGLFCLSLLAAIPVSGLADVTTIQADTVELDTNLAAASANGNAILTYGKLSLHADAITANRATGDVVAVGNLSLCEADRRLCGGHLQYNLHTDEGVLTQAQVVEQGVIVRGELIEFSPKKFVARHASFTTCTKERPDYSLDADTITLTAAATDARGRPVSGRLTLNRAKVYFHGKRLVTLPNYSVSVGGIQEGKASPLPTSGFSRNDGLYTQLDYTLSRPDRPVLADARVRLTTHRGLTGLVEARRLYRSHELFADYTHRQDVRQTELQADQLTFSTANVLVNRAPEFGARTDDYPLSKFLHLAADARYGRYTEFDADGGELNGANRFSASALVSTDPYPVLHDLLLSHAVGYRAAYYSTDDRFAIGFFRTTVQFPRSDENHLALSYIGRSTSGRTPFLFDDVQVGSELLADFRHRLSPAWRLRAIGAYDLEDGSTRDVAVSLTRTVHCLDYTLGWKQLSRTFFFGITLAPMPAGQAPTCPQASAPGRR